MGSVDKGLVLKPGTEMTDPGFGLRSAMYSVRVDWRSYYKGPMIPGFMLQVFAISYPQEGIMAGRTSYKFAPTYPEATTQEDTSFCTRESQFYELPGIQYRGKRRPARRKRSCLIPAWCHILVPLNLMSWSLTPSPWCHRWSPLDGIDGIRVFASVDEFGGYGLGYRNSK